MAAQRKEFRFGIEAEYLLVEARTFRALWHRDLNFERLNAALESIDTSDLPPLDGLELERPHRKLMPYAVEGYHVPDPDLNPIDLWPKGIEIRTPVCTSIAQCLDCLARLHLRLQVALAAIEYQVVALSHHPVEYQFSGPQNKRRYDFWQWAMEVMVTYGPDVNVSLPSELADRIIVADLHAKVNYYAPALAALTLASPILNGDLWRIRGNVGRSIRTYRRSVIAPAIELHPEEAGRMEFKVFEMTNRLQDFDAYILLWLALLLDDGLRGRASNQSRVYDLGRIAVHGLKDETAYSRASELLERAPGVLDQFGFEAGALDRFAERIDARRVPADEMIEEFARHGDLARFLRPLSKLHREPTVDSTLQRIAS